MAVVNMIKAYSPLLIKPRLFGVCYDLVKCRLATV